MIIAENRSIAITPALQIYPTTPPSLPRTDHTFEGKGVAEPSDAAYYRTSAPPADRFDSTEVMAQYLKYYNDDPGAEAYEFYSAVYKHKDDAQWLQNFYRALGPDATAQMINQADIYVYDDRSAKTVAESLTTMVRDGGFTQSDMDALMRSMSTSSDGSVYALSKILDQIPTTSCGDEVRTMFANSTEKVATQDKVNGDHHNFRQSGFAALATRALSELTPKEQVDTLNRWRKDFGEDKFAKLIQSSMSASYPGPASDKNASDPDFGKISSLVQTVASAGAKYEGRSLTPALLPSAELDALSTSVFNAVAQGLSSSGVMEKYDSNVPFKDAMSNIFMGHFDSIVASGINKDAAYSNLFDTKFKQGLENFFKTTLFSNEKLATKHQQLLGYMGNKMNQLTGMIEKGDISGAQQLLGGMKNGNDKPMTKDQLAGVAGQLFGTVGKAFIQYQEGLPDEAAKRTAAVNFIVDMVSGVVGVGVGTATTGNPIAGSLIGTAQGAGVTAIKEAITKGELGELKRALAKNYAGIDPEDIIRNWVENIGNGFGNGGEFYDKFVDVSGMHG